MAIHNAVLRACLEDVSTPKDLLKSATKCLLELQWLQKRQKLFVELSDTKLVVLVGVQQLSEVEKTDLQARARRAAAGCTRLHVPAAPRLFVSSCSALQLTADCSHAAPHLHCCRFYAAITITSSTAAIAICI